MKRFDGGSQATMHAEQTRSCTVRDLLFTAESKARLSDGSCVALDHHNGWSFWFRCLDRVVWQELPHDDG